MNNIKTVGTNGQISLGKKYAGQTVMLNEPSQIALQHFFQRAELNAAAAQAGTVYAALHAEVGDDPYVVDVDALALAAGEDGQVVEAAGPDAGGFVLHADAAQADVHNTCGCHGPRFADSQKGVTL